MISPAARSYFSFLLVVVGAMLFAAVASPWAQNLLSSFGELPLHRVFSRLMLLGMIAGTTMLVCRPRRHRIDLLGLDRPRPQFLRRALWGLVAGLTLMAIALLPLMLLHVRIWNAQIPGNFVAWLMLAVKGLASGIAVAMLEETFFRGAMQGSLQRLGGTRWALFAVPLLYSALHFIGRGTVPAEQINAWSGFVVWRESLLAFATPLHIFDAFAALYFVGLLLALVRHRWGDIAGCIGLHAGFVAVIAVFRKITITAPQSDWSFLVGSFDGLLGVWIAALTAATCLLLWRSHSLAQPQEQR